MCLGGEKLYDYGEYHNNNNASMITDPKDHHQSPHLLPIASSGAAEPNLSVTEASGHWQVLERQWNP
jgi:hypothetical protein